MKTFCGWVPTITGNLSFAIVGQGRNPKRAFKVSRAVDGTRYVVVAQMRRTTDTPFGYAGDLLNRLLGREGYTVYVFFGKSLRSEQFNVLSGPCIELTRSQFKKAKTRLAELVLEKLGDPEFDTRFEEVAAWVSEQSALPGCGFSAVELERNGKVVISFEESLQNREAQDVASQIYFFLRDVCHVHQHHAPTSDTILDVVPFTGADISWKRETLYSLFRWVIQQKRSRNPSAYIDAKGVLAYARAFSEKHFASTEHTDNQVQPDSDADGPLPVYSRDATIESLDAGLERARREEAAAGRFTKVVFNRIVPSIALALAFLTPFYQSNGIGQLSDQEIMVSRFADWLNANLLTVGGAIAFTITLANFAIVLRSSIFTSPVWFDFFRILFPIPYWLVVSATTLLTLSLILLSAQQYLDFFNIPYNSAP